jgi:hypothetical protein
MRSNLSIPERDKVSLNTPLRLDIAARLYFPDGSISGRSLEKEAAKGNLQVMRIAGKSFTTLDDLASMCNRCRTRSNLPDSICERPETTEAPSGSSSTTASSIAQGRAKKISQELKRRSLTISHTKPDQPSAKVIPLKS